MTTYTAAHRAYYETNKERIKAQRLARERAWNATPQGKYSVQKRKAKRRSIPWNLTFDQWWDIWQHSGKWLQRGDRTGMYCMSRYGDTGPYSAGNVFINSFEANTKESYIKHGVDKRGRFKNASTSQ